MKPLKSIAGFVFRRGLVGAAGAVPVAGVRQAAAWTAGAVAHHFTSHATELSLALENAHESAWGALAFSLGDDSALDLLRGADSRHLREQLRTFLRHVAPGHHAGADNAEFRQHCLAQLRAAKRSGLLDGGGIDMQELCRHVGSFAEMSNSARLLDAERTALAALAAEFPTKQFPQLRVLLELSPGDSEPFLIVAAEFFFRRQIATSESLARVVGYDLQIALLREQRDGQADIILKMDQQARALMEQLALLRRDLRPQDGCSMQNEAEQRLVRALLKQFRELPTEQQQALPDLLGDLGRLAFAAGEFKESRAACSDAAALAVADPAKAQAHHNAYLAALEDRDWAAALESLRNAVALDPVRYMPFPFEKYQPGRILGAGGFGVAFLCDHARLSRRVVIKTLQPAQLNRDVAELFREAKDLEDLTHPGIVRLRDADYGDAEQKRPYFVMDFFDGKSLNDHVQAHGPLPLEQAVDLARQLAQALAAAHDKGILHRDVKPRNLLIGINHGRVDVKLIDFGLALRQTTARTVVTGNTLLGSSQAGTLDYAAPEQLGKLPGVKVDKYSDVYSWAKTLCFALFGVPPPPLLEFHELPAALKRLLGDSLAERRHEIVKRPATMQIVLERLSALHQPPDLAPPPVLDRASDPPRIAPRPPSNVAPPTKIVVPNAASAPVTPPPEILDSAADHVRIRDREFERIRNASSDVLRLEGWWRSPVHCATVISHAKGLLQLRPDDPWVGQLLQLVWDRAPCCLLDANDRYDRIANLAGSGSDFYTAHFSPDGKTVCVAGEASVATVYDVESAKALPEIRGHAGFIRMVRFSPDGSMLLTASADGTARITILRDRQLLRVFPQPGRALCAEWPPDGHSILVGGDDGNLISWGITDLSQSKRFVGHQGRVFSCAFSADGSAAASTGEDGTLRLWDAKTGAPIGKPCKQAESVYDVALPDNGSTAITACADGFVRIVDLKTMNVIHNLKAHHDVVWSVGVFRGDRIAASGSADGKVVLWDLTRYERLQVMDVARDWIRAVAISPDGRHFAACGDGQLAALWRIQPRKAEVTRSQLIAQLRQDATSRGASA